MERKTKSNKIIARVTVEAKLESDFENVRPLFIMYRPLKGVSLDAYKEMVVQPGHFGIWCPFCFHCGDQQTIGEHLKNEECEWRDRTPGLLIYSHDAVQVYEIDPDIDSAYCDNLFGYGKVHKVRTLGPDSEKLADIEKRHMVYLVVRNCYNGNVPVGFFTKEKNGKANVFEGMWLFRWYMHMGFDTFMLSIAYQMAAAQKIIGHVERPWDSEFFEVYQNLVLDTTAQYLSKQDEIEKKNLNLFLMELAEKTSFHPSHLAEILVNQKWIDQENGHLTLKVSKKQLQDHRRFAENRGRYSKFHKSSLKWKPNKFSPMFSEYQISKSWPIAEVIEEITIQRHNINVELGNNLYPADQRFDVENWKKGRKLIEDHIHSFCDQPGSSPSQCFCDIFF